MDDDRVAAWWRAHPQGGNVPLSYFNDAGPFTLVADVSSAKTGLRSGGTADLEPAGDFLMKDFSSKKKQPFDYENLLLPNGPPIDDDYKATASENAVPIRSYSLPALKAVRDHFTKETGRYNDAVSAGTDDDFRFNWLGKYDGSMGSLVRALRCLTPTGKAHERVATFVEKLNAKIKEFKAAAAAA